MPFTTAQIATGATYSLATFQKKEPIDQINIQHVTLDYLIKNKEVSNFGNGSFKEPIFVANGSNAQNYFGADQVTYNERDPAKWTDWGYANLHDGFWFDEDRLLAAGIHMAEDASSVPTATEKEALVNLLGQSFRALKNGIQEAMAFEFLRDGSQSTKAIPGLSHIIKTSPGTGVVGGIDSATATYWQNNANTSITTTEVVAEMQTTWDDCMRYGGRLPDFIPCGQAFLNNYRTQANAAVNRQIMNTKGGVTIDPSTGDLFFHGVPLKWDPTFEALDTLLSTTTWTKTAFFLNKASIKLRPLKGEWMRNRRPENLPDRYVTYFGQTSKYGLTSDKRNALAVLTIA